MSADRAEKKYGNTLHPNNAAGMRGNRWLSSESAVEFSTKRSSDSWLGSRAKVWLMIFNLIKQEVTNCLRYSSNLQTAPL